MMQWCKCLLLICLLTTVAACKHEKEVNPLRDRIESLEEQLVQMNSDLSSINLLVNVLQNQLSITDIEINEVDKYIITFSDGSQITIKDGKDDVDSQNVPIIGIGIWEGMYYWVQTVDGVSSWLTDVDGNKISVGGKNAIIPQLRVNMEGYWMVSYDNGINYELMSDENGSPILAVGKDGGEKDGDILVDSFFREVEIEGSELILTLADGNVLHLPIEGNGTQKIESVVINGFIDMEQLEGLKVVSLIDEEIIDEGTFTIRIPKSEQTPQLLFVTNTEGDILLMGRSFYEEGINKISVESTAFALVASHPVFAPIEKADYSELQDLVISSPAFPALCAEVQKSAEARQDIFDIHNTALIQSLNMVLDDLCSSVVNVENRLSKTATTRATSTDLNVYPFYVTSGTDCVEIRNTRLSPPYEYIVRRKGLNNIWEEYEKGLLPTRDSYGFTDLFKTVGEIHLSEPVTIHFPIDGEYDFYFDKTSDRAVKELQKALLNDALSIIGVSGSDVIDLVADGGNLIIQGGDVKDCVEYASTLIEAARKKIDKGDALEYLKFLDNAKKFIDKFNVLYNSVKGAANEVARILWAIDAPQSVDFCCSCFEGEVMPCAQSKLRIISGNTQIGSAGNYLSLPLKVQVTSVNPADGSSVHAKYHQVKFEIMQGNGSLSQTLVETNSEGYAETRWKLGDGSEGEVQKVRAVIIDVTTGSEVGASLVFTATVKDSSFEDFTILANHRDITSHTVTITCTYPQVVSNAVFGVTIHMDESVKPWKDCVAKGNVGGQEYTFYIEDLSPETTYFYVPYVLYNGTYYNGERRYFTTLPEEDEDIKLSTGDVIDLGLRVKWASCNLGALSPEEYGEYFPFNKDMEQTCQTYLTNGLRIPTKEDIEELIEKCNIKDITYKGVKGILVTGPNGNNIFLPRAGMGRLSYVNGDPNNSIIKIEYDSTKGGNACGCYWTKTVATKEWWLGAYTLFFQALASVSWDDGPGVDPGHYYVYHTIRAVTN